MKLYNSTAFTNMTSFQIEIIQPQILFSVDTYTKIIEHEFHLNRINHRIYRKETWSQSIS